MLAQIASTASAVSIPKSASSSFFFIKASTIRLAQGSFLCSDGDHISVPCKDLLLSSRTCKARPALLPMPYDFTPALLRNVIIGHQFVKADWNKFNPTNAVKRNQ